MKYEVGDKVRIKTWEQMKKEFGMDGSDINTPHYIFPPKKERDIDFLKTNRVLTISASDGLCYGTEELLRWSFVDDMILSLADEPINNRFEILDL